MTNNKDTADKQLLADKDAQIAAVIATAVAKTASETAAAVVKTASDAAANLLINNSSTSSNVATDIGWIKNDIRDIKSSIKEVTGTFVTKVEFDPIKRGFYLLISLIAAALVAAGMGVLLIKR